MTFKLQAVFAAAAFVATLPSSAANAATVVQSFDGASSWTVAKFDPSLGTLNSVVVNVTSGFAQYKITLNGYFAAPVSYTATAYAGIYLGFLTADGSLSGAGIADFDNGEAEILVPLIPYSVNIPVPTDPTSFAYESLIGLDTSTAYLQLDSPLIIFGDLAGLNVDEITTTGRNAGWNVIFDYTPFRGAVPEPSTWAMMLLGFGLIGGALRHQRRAERAAYP